MAACNLGNCTIHETLKSVSEILLVLVGNDDNTRDDDNDDDGDGDDKDDDSRLTGGMKLW